MKRLFSILVTLTLVLAMASPVFAAESAQMTISASKSTAVPGETVDFTVSISQVDDCRSGGIVISYDSAVFEYVSGRCLVSGAVMSDFSGGTGVFAFSEGISLSGDIFQFTLKVRSDAPVATSPVSGSPSVRTGAGQLSCGISGTSITVRCEHSYGGWTAADGSHQRTCAKCGSIETSGHTWNEGTVTKAPTCKDTGSKEVTCTLCGATSTVSIDKTNDHAWGSGQKVDGSTHKHTCSVCGAESVTSHNWDAGTVTTSATCRDSGLMTYTCTVCNATATETIAKTDDHTWESCESVDGDTHKYVCAVCGTERLSVHEWDAGAVTAAATCKENGIMTYTCTVCGAAATEPIEKSAVHTYDHDCDPACNVCGESREVSHVYEAAWTADESGHWHQCTVCEEGDALTPHDFENDCATDCPTCGYTREAAHVYGQAWLSNGSSHWQECTVCGAASEALPHTPGAEATENAAQVCTVCAYELVPALGHSFGECWNSDEENHWHECACGERTDEDTHLWDDGTEQEDRSVTYACTVCGAQKTQAPQGLPPAAWAVIFIVLIGIGIVLFAWFLPKKKVCLD